MKQAARQIAVCVIGLFIACILGRLTIFRTLTVSYPAGFMKNCAPADARLEILEGDSIQIGIRKDTADALRFTVIPVKKGTTWISILDQEGNSLAMRGFRVGLFNTVTDLSGSDFTGDSAVLIAVTILWMLITLIMAYHFFQATGPDFYSYTTVYFSGFSIFALVSAAVMLTVTIRHLRYPTEYNMLTVYSSISGASGIFIQITMMPVLVFAVAMAVSNLVLLRHERPQRQNVLGLLVAVLLIGCELLYLYTFFRNFSGSELEWRITNTVQNVCATAFVYFECVLIGSVICGTMAARYEPSADRDFIVILGCWFRADGSLPPLLRGRVDRAVAFWRKQKEQTGREAILIPSGGQGADEPMPEAEAMKRYLLEQGIPEEQILTESRSRNTLQNMLFSKEIIKAVNPEGKTAFVTTNYHVFRSGVWAGEAGLRAEGMGGKTKWWFWPNAFMRECLGLLQKRWKQELLFLFLMVLFYGALSMLLY